MKIAKVKEHIGAIVTGIDLAHPIDGATQRKLYDAIVENVVLVIRGQGLRVLADRHRPAAPPKLG